MRNQGISGSIYPETFLMKYSSPQGKSGGPGWINETRVVFWVWSWIRTADSSKLQLTFGNETSNFIPYVNLSLPLTTNSHMERKVAIAQWFSGMKKYTNLAQLKILAEQLEDEWYYIYKKIKPISFMKPTPEHTVWGWNYLLKIKYFNKGITEFLHPSSPRERLHAINAVFDFILVEDREFDTAIKQTLQLRMKNAFSKQKSRMSQSDCKSVDISLPIEVKEQLKIIAHRKRQTYSTVIETLIRKEYNDNFKWK